MEFDVHPSAFPISISASEFIYIRNDDGNFIDQERESVYVANEGCDEMDGCGGVDQITFKARHTGEGAVSLIYHRVDEEAIDQFDMLRW